MTVFNYRSNENLLFANRMRKLIKELIVFKTRKLIACLLSLQSSISPELKSKVVYKISCCGCNSTYVVQSVRYLTARIDEYRKKVSETSLWLKKIYLNLFRNKKLTGAGIGK